MPADTLNAAATVSPQIMVGLIAGGAALVGGIIAGGCELSDRPPSTLS